MWTLCHLWCQTCVNSEQAMSAGQCWELFNCLLGKQCGDNNWSAPCKPAWCDDFVVIFQVAQNQLKFGMPTPFLWNNVPPTSLQQRKRHTQCFGSQGLKSSTLFGDGQRGGKGLNFTEFYPYFSAFLKEKQGHFLTQKEWTCQISADSEPLGKSLQNSHIELACTEPLNYYEHK